MNTIGGYRVVRLLGKGGMAEVYEVEHPTLGIRRALKVFRADGERAELLRAWRRGFSGRRATCRPNGR